MKGVKILSPLLLSSMLLAGCGRVEAKQVDEPKPIPVITNTESEHCLIQNFSNVHIAVVDAHNQYEVPFLITWDKYTRSVYTPLPLTTIAYSQLLRFIQINTLHVSTADETLGIVYTSNDVPVFVSFSVGKPCDSPYQPSFSLVSLNLQ